MHMKKQQRGGTVVGFILGVIVGLGGALAVAVAVTGQWVWLPLALCVCAVVVWKHKENIARLRAGTEKSWLKGKHAEKQEDKG